MSTGTHHYDALAGLKTAVENLALTGLTNATPLPAGRVYLRELLSDRNVTLPCVVVSLAPMPEGREIQDNTANQVSYPCLVAILAPANQDLALEQVKLQWRQEIEDVFDFKQPPELLDALSDELTLRRTEWQPLDVIDLAAFQDKNLFVSAAIVWVIVLKPRG